MAGAAQQECPSCGAPLPAVKGATEVKCQYCGATVVVESKPDPKPRPSSRPAYASRGSSRAAIAVIAVTTLLPVGITTFAVFGSTITGAWASRTLTFPVSCGNNETLEIVGKTFSGQGTIILAGLNCKLRIKDSKLSGDVVVLAKLNNDITIENSTLEGRDAAIWLETNGHVRATNGTVLRGTSTAIRGGVNTTLEFEDAKVEGGTDGITGDVDTEIHGLRTSIGGHDTGISLQTNGQVFGNTLTVQGAIVGIEGGTNLTVQLENSSAEGGEAGAKGGGNLHVTLTKKSRVSGKAAGIDAGSNLELTLDDSTVASDDTGARTRSNPHLRLTHGGRIHGGRLGVDAGENLQATLQDGAVEGGATAFCGKYNAQIDARNASIAGVVALHFEREPEVRLNATTVNGSQLFDLRGCGTVPRHAGFLTRAPRVAPSAPIALPASRVPPFDAATRASGLVRTVDLK